MANLITCAFFSLYLLFLATPTAFAHDQKLDNSEKAWFQNICQGKETVVKIQVYLQDVLTGPNTTLYEVARASITPNSSTGFGQVQVLDDRFTAGPDYNSQLLGQAQGLITYSDLENAALAMNINLYFTAGEYNGSTICLLGRNGVFNTERELAVVGGTGKFRMARGYVIATTYSYNADYGVVLYTLYVALAEDLASRVSKEFNPIGLATE